MSEAVTYTSHTQQGVLLNANENPYPMEPALVKELQEAITRLNCHRYPDDEAAALRDVYGQWLGVDADQIIAGNGSDQMLQLLIDVCKDAGRPILTLVPDFGMYDFYAASYGAPMYKYPLDGMQGLDVQDFIDTILETKPSLVLFSNPNNPYGTMVSRQDIETIARAIAPIPLAVDEAYMEFGQDSALPLLEDNDNLYITRTLSKAFGLAGLRVGFLISSKDNIKALLPHKVVYNLNSFSMKAAEIVLRHADVYARQIQEIMKQRDRLAAFLEQKGIGCGPANANYLCVYPEDVEAWKEAFEARGVQLRFYAGQPYVRITAGTPEQMDLVMEIIETLVPQPAELQDSEQETEMEASHAHCQ